MFFFLFAFVFLCVWLPEVNYRVVHERVKQRHAAGDALCGVRRTWYGWRVVEYGECDQ
jgi:hypothetical protein